MTTQWKAVLATGLLGGALALAGCNGGGGSKGPDTPNGGGGNDSAAVATVKSSGETGTITRGDWVKALQGEFGKQVLDQLEDQVLIQQEAKRQGVTVDDKEYQQKLDEYHKDPRYKQAVANGVDAKALDDNLRTNMLLKKLVLKEKITEQDKLRFYDRFKDQLTQLHIAHILVTDEKEAERIRGEALKGGDFNKLATQYSKDTGSKDSGGDIGWVMTGQLMQEWGKAALDTPVGKISPVVRSQYGFHIIKVLGKRSSYEDLKPEVEDQIAVQAQKPYVDLLRAKAQITDPFSKGEMGVPPASGSPSAAPSASASK